MFLPAARRKYQLAKYRVRNQFIVSYSEEIEAPDEFAAPDLALKKAMGNKTFEEWVLGGDWARAEVIELSAAGQEVSV